MLRVIFAMAALTSPLSAAEADPKAEVKAVADLLAGSYSSVEQSKKDTAYFDVHLNMVPVWADRADGPWLYVEQAMAAALDKPYRQRMYKLEWNDGAVLSRVYTLPGDALKYAGAHADAKKLADLRPEQLVEKTGCTIVLKKQADGTWKGKTVEKGCASELKGAKYATSEVMLSPKLLTSWDRGFDKEDKQVWGAVKGPYEFVKATK
jgi:ketosteroid isomerase-like protein